MTRSTFVILLLLVGLVLLLLALAVALGWINGNEPALEDGGLAAFVGASLVERLP